MPNQSTDHVYSTPLDENQIRIVALQPGKGNDTLECQIRLVDARAETSYDAISYVWGSQDTTEVIRCTTNGDGRQVDLPLTRNAADALRAVRKADGVRLVWIDCLCISQTSNAEKAAQVGMMDNIFANATTVLIWLGADDKRQAGAAAEIATLIHECFEDETRYGVGYPEETVAVKQIGSVLRQKCYDELGSVLPLFECEWFWRLWCVQELALAKQPVIFWGPIVLTWEVVLTATAFIEGRAQLSIAHTGYAGVHNVIMLESLREQAADWKIRRVPFSRLLSLTRLHGVTEPCDRIFSLLGLDRQLNINSDVGIAQQVEDWWRDGGHASGFSFPTMPETQSLVIPDYSQGIDNLYLSTAKALLTRERNLHLLSFVQHEAQAGQGSLPSWVPQWHINKHRLVTQFDLLPDHPIYASLRATLARSVIDVESGANLLAGGASLDSFVVNYDNVIRTQGLLLATILKSCTNAAFTADPGYRWLETLRAWYQSVSAWFAQNCRPDHSDAPQDQPNDKVFRVFYATLLGGHFRAKDVFLGLRTELESFKASVRSGSTDDTNLFPTTRAFVTQICRSRTLFLTDAGQLGIGPQCLEPGDCVCFLAGAAVPLILRPREVAEGAHRPWILVGETYVNQLAGEGIEPLDSDEDDELARNLPSTPAETPTFLKTLGSARVDRSYTMFSNIGFVLGLSGQLYYSDLGKIEIRRADGNWNLHTSYVPSGSAIVGDSGAVNARSYERIQFNIV